MWKKFLIPYYINSFWAEPWLGGPVASQNLFFMGGRLPRNFFFWWNSLKVGMSISNNILKVTPQWAIWPTSSQTFSEISNMLLFFLEDIWLLHWVLNEIWVVFWDLEKGSVVSYRHVFLFCKIAFLVGNLFGNFPKRLCIEGLE